jgi:hypothetical protein
MTTLHQRAEWLTRGNLPMSTPRRLVPVDAEGTCTAPAVGGRLGDANLISDRGLARDPIKPMQLFSD